MECCNVSTDWRNESKQGNRWISNQRGLHWLVWCYENIGKFLSLYLWFICVYSSPEALNKTWPCSASTKRSINHHSYCFRPTTYLALWISHTALAGHARMALNFMGEMRAKIENSSDLLLLPSLPFSIIFYFSLYLSSSFCGNEMLSQLSASLLNTLIHYKCYQSQCFPLGEEKVMTDTGNASPSMHTCVIVAYFHSFPTVFVLPAQTHPETPLHQHQKSVTSYEAVMLMRRSWQNFCDRFGCIRS